MQNKRIIKRNKRSVHTEYKVKDILSNDGVKIVDVDNITTPIITSLKRLKGEFPAGKSWAKRVINTFNSAFFNSATLISQNKGEGCRRHKHPDCDEFWVILSGRIKIEIGAENKKVKTVSAGDIVYFKKGTFHKLTVISEEPGIRLSVSVEAMQNIYVE